MKVDAIAHRSGDWWAVEVPDVEGGIHTQARRLDQVPDVAADAVGLMLDIEPGDVEVTVTPVLPADASEAVRAAGEKSRAAVKAAEEASRAMRVAVTVLRNEEHLTARDAARVLGVTHQRVSQLEKV